LLSSLPEAICNDCALYCTEKQKSDTDTEKKHAGLPLVSK